MATEAEIRRRLQEMAGLAAPDVSIIYRVQSVNEEDCTCTLVDDTGQELFGVRLRPVTGKNKSLVQIPREGSFVLAVRIESTEEWMVVACDEVERVHLIVGNSELVITEDDILINGGRLGGLVKISELTAKLNELVQIYNSHTHAGNGVPTTMLASPFNKGDYENVKVKH